MRTSHSKGTRVARRLRRRGLQLALLAVGMVILRAEACSKEDFYDPFSTNGGGLDFTVDLGLPDLDYCHIALGDTRNYTGFGTNPARPGATYSASWTGPGTVGGTTRTGTLDASGRGYDEQMINMFGSYTVEVSVTADGLTRMATGTTNVTSNQGACEQL